MSKIVIVMDGGLINNVLTSNPADEILVIDYDSEGAGSDEIISQQEVDEFLGGTEVIDRAYRKGVSEEDINL
jgi:hypothetical protein